MSLKRVVSLYVDEIRGIQSVSGHLVADLEDGSRVVVGRVPEDTTVTHPTGVLPEYMPTTTGYPTMVLTRAAQRLLATQNNDGGWQWNNPDTNPAHGVPSPYNTLGVTAQGMLDCYIKSPLLGLLDACKSTYDAIAKNAADVNPSKHRIRGPDIAFLVELSEKTGVATYANLAKARWESAKTEFGGGTAAGFAEFIRDARKGQNLPALISWDIDIYLQGVLALNRYFDDDGYDDEALAMAEVIYTSLYVAPVDFDITDDTQAEFWIGIIGALEAFVSNDIHETECESLTTQLLASQQNDGHFEGINGGSDVQTTAYAVMALLKAGKTRAAEGAVNYLLGSQQGTGGWLYGAQENTEVTSEAAQAIYDYI